MVYLQNLKKCGMCKKCGTNEDVPQDDTVKRGKADYDVLYFIYISEIFIEPNDGNHQAIQSRERRALYMFTQKDDCQ